MADRFISLTQFLIEENRHSNTVPSDLKQLIEIVAQACKSISTAVGKGALANVLGIQGNINVQGEVQKKLDVMSNNILLEATQWSGCLAGMASEEMEHAFPIPNEYPKGNYLLLFDPLDGSSNIDVNVSIGTIFSILKRPEKTTDVTENDFLQTGRHQVATGYAIYGPQTQLVLTTGNGVNAFTLDREDGIWKLTSHQIRIPEQTAEYAINASNQRHWFPPVKRYFEEVQAGVEGPRGKNFNMRWIAAMVSDINRILTRGGIFMYPADARNIKNGGRIRLMYEANPMSMLIEQAGGAATNGLIPLMDVKPEKLHMRVPVFLGSKQEVELITKYHREAQ